MQEVSVDIFDLTSIRRPGFRATEKETSCLCLFLRLTNQLRTSRKELQVSLHSRAAHQEERAVGLPNTVCPTHDGPSSGILRDRNRRGNFRSRFDPVQRCLPMSRALAGFQLAGSKRSKQLAVDKVKTMAIMAPGDFSWVFPTEKEQNRTLYNCDFEDAHLVLDVGAFFTLWRRFRFFIRRHLDDRSRFAKQALLHLLAFSLWPTPGSF